ncbi:unnamed protein product [Ophioblennius macclurei]
MASTFENDLNCTVCCDVFVDPVILSCSHSFCRVCVQSWWTKTQTSECPLCRIDSKELSSNLVLKQLCESFQQLRLERRSTCSLHAEKLNLFCLDHQEPACLVCRDSRKHSGHTMRPVDEAAQQQRKQLEEKLQHLKESIQVGEQGLAKFDLAARHARLQARQAETQIKETFEKFHRFLKEEEEAKLAALREEEEQKVRTMKEKMEALKKEMDLLSRTVRVAEEELRAEDIAFLLGCKATKERVQRCPPLEEPRLPAGALIQQAKHLGNLSFNIWSRMMLMVSFTPVILDPNTADPEFHFSQDLTGVSMGVRRPLPDNPERLSDSVLGSEALGSGIHCWDIQVGDSSGWELGVLSESALSGNDLQSGSWTLWFSGDVYSAVSPSHQDFHLQVRKKLRRIRVLLDCSKGRLSFSDADSDTHIHTFTHDFTQRMFPYIKTVNDFKILPGKFSVRVKKHT